MRVQLALAAGLVLAWSTGAGAALTHRYSFTSDASDSVGGANGTVVDPGTTTNATLAGGKLDVSANSGQGSDGITEDAYVNFPNGIFTGAVTGGAAGQATVEIWSQSSTNRNWAALFSAGTSNLGEDHSSAGDQADYIQLIPHNGQNGLIRATTHAKGVGAEGSVDYTTDMSTLAETQFVAVFDQSGGLPGTITMYINGALVGSSPVAAGLNLSTMTDNNIWLGRSQWNDPVFDGSYDELRIYNSALSGGDVASRFQAGPNAVPEPATWAIVATALAAGASWRRRGH